VAQDAGAHGDPINERVTTRRGYSALVAAQNDYRRVAAPVDIVRAADDTLSEYRSIPQVRQL
jgi:hypothetical protein